MRKEVRGKTAQRAASRRTTGTAIHALSGLPTADGRPHAARLFLESERREVAAPGAHERRRSRGQVDDRRRFRAAETRFDHEIHLLADPLADVFRVGQRMVLAEARPSAIEHFVRAGNRSIPLTPRHGGIGIALERFREIFDQRRLAPEARQQVLQFPRGLAGAPYLETNRISVEGLSEPKRVFSGTACEGAAGFPANVNVAAALSLAGIGPDRTMMEIWADPTVDRNCHSIEVDSDSARFTLAIENIPSENPKTGRITSLSALAALRKLVSPLRVGT